MSMTTLSVISNTKTLSDETALAPRNTRQADLDGAYSGYGGSQEIYCPEGIPVEQALFGILAAFGASFGFLFRAVTIATAKRRRKRMAEDGAVMDASTTVWEDLQNKAADMYWWGRSHTYVHKTTIQFVSPMCAYILLLGHIKTFGLLKFIFLPSYHFSLCDKGLVFFVEMTKKIPLF